jgi:transcriptional regulator with XRE-family HTH domain
MAQNELGDQLRRARESKSLSLEDVERATGIRKRFLQALEEGRFDALPGPVQVRGFLKSYANCLGQSPEEVLARYERQTHSTQTAAALQSASPARPVAMQPAPPKSQPMPSAAVTQPARPAAPSASATPTVAKPQPTQPVTPAAPSVLPAKPTSLAAVPAARSFQLPAWLTLEVGLIALAVILLVCVGALAASVFLGPASSQQPAPATRPTATRATRAAPPPPTVPLATPSVTPLTNITSSVETTRTVGYVQVALAATEHVWVRVTADGKTAFEGMFSPGQALNWEAKELVVVEAGNGAGLTASFNGKPVGVLGQRGQLVARAWTPTGETVVPRPAASLPTSSPTP